MTISYAGNFAGLLLRWKGSLWKAVWKELFVWLAIYYVVRLVYNVILDEEQRTTFEQVSLIFNEYLKSMPITFLLGFYVSLIVTRWWAQFQNVAWPDDLLSLLCAVWRGSDADAVASRHTAARYINLASVLAWRDVSVKVRARFPTMEHVLHSGLMTEAEFKLYNAIQVDSVRWQLPLHWIQRMVENRMADGKVPPPVYNGILNEIKGYRAKYRQLFCYDWVCVPLVYTQVAALATYGYFALCIIGRQFLDPGKGIKFAEVDFYFPIFTVGQFLFYVGWFKVGQDLMRPFGTDDDDIELNYILDRNIAASFSLVHRACIQLPPAASRNDTDKFLPLVMDGADVNELPHTKFSRKTGHDHPPKLHAKILLKNPKLAEEAPPIDDMTQSAFLRMKMERKNWRYF